MRIIKTAYSKTFPISQYFEKIFLEAEINEGDDVRKVLYDLKKQVADFFYESNKAAEKQMGTQIKDVEEEYKPTLTQVADLIKEIKFCKSYEVLEKTYKYIAQSDPDVQHAYDIRREELKQKEISQILEKTELKTTKSKK